MLNQMQHNGIGKSCKLRRYRSRLREVDNPDGLKICPIIYMLLKSEHLRLFLGVQQEHHRPEEERIYH